MKSEQLTYFAPAEVADEETLQRQIGYFRENPILKTLLDAQPVYILILNTYRQIVYANSVLTASSDLGEVGDVTGLRPGEALRCIHSYEERMQCGTTIFCRTCGAVNAILKSQKGDRQVEECRIYQSGDAELNALDLRVWATPFSYNDEKFTIFSLLDISHEKRRKALERIFFHDILNTAGIIQGFSTMLLAAEKPEDLNIFKVIHDASNRLVEEILAQKDLAAAESGDLKIQRTKFKVREFLEFMASSYDSTPLADRRMIETITPIEDIEVNTDRTLISRVIGNMLKNALEASQAGETITLGAQTDNDSIIFRVHNKAFIPEKIRLQIFKRSFSTKGKGRGLGTYSIKLLTEKYLKGSDSVRSTESEGTYFEARIPQK